MGKQPLIRRLTTRDRGLDIINELSDNVAADARVDARVREIVADVARRGDEALVAYTSELDGWDVADALALEVPRARMDDALSHLAADDRRALESAADRLRVYAEHQKLEDADYTDFYGSRLGHVVRPIERAGVYVPGGAAAYPSSVLMNTVPARAAGVDQVIMVSPTPGGRVNEWVLAAAALAGVNRFFAVGGAQAIAALAYGTDTLPAVDKIVGPGNAYVAAAKRQVFGRVGIESVAGPSEVLIIADASANPRWLALDLCAQAEHDPGARATLVCPDAAMLDAVERCLSEEVDQLPRAEIIRASFSNNGALIEVSDLDEAVALANRVAPEHLELAITDARDWVEHIRHAGAVFIGHCTPEVLGDYCAGPNHVLPTGRTARFSSALGTYDFQKRVSVVEASATGAAQLAPVAERLARAEGLDAHAASAHARGLLGDS